MDAREARRRRILERGSDRFALITGQIRSIPDSCSPPPPTPTNVEAQQAAELRFVLESESSGDEIIKQRWFWFTWHSNLVAPLREDDFATLNLSYQHGKNYYANQTASGRGKSDRSNEISETHSSDEITTGEMGNDAIKFESGHDSEVKAQQNERDSEALSTSIAQKSSDVVVDAVFTTGVKKQKLFSSKQISHAVSSSENMRLLFVVIIALLVVFSNRVYVLSGGVMRSIINFRPLFIVMLTDLTIVLWLLMTTQSTDEKGKERAGTGIDAPGWNILEAWLMFQSVARAIFMDCSFCAVIIISGLCI